MWITRSWRRRLPGSGLPMGSVQFLRLTGTGSLPKRGAPGRFACGLGTVWLLVTAWAFYSGFMLAGYILGALLVLVAGLVSTIHFCIPSLTYRLIFGLPSKTGEDEGMMCKTGVLCHR